MANNSSDKEYSSDNDSEFSFHGDFLSHQDISNLQPYSFEPLVSSDCLEGENEINDSIVKHFEETFAEVLLIFLLKINYK
jgi:hypothetical protein